MNFSEAVREAGRCLYCYDAPCIKGCPAQVDIPAFIRAIKTEDMYSAAKIIIESNCLGGSCARVCPVDELCEGNCTLNNIESNSVGIARLQGFAIDLAIENKWKFFEEQKPNGMSVAIIGAGPSGLACAFDLLKLGWKVDIYDSRKLPGGLNTYAISKYKVPIQFIKKEIEFLFSNKLKLKSGITIGKDISIGALLEKYDSVYLGIGLGKSRALAISGENLDGVWDALDFIEMTKFTPENKLEIGKNVVVIGGGNTAIDSAIAAKKLGAENVIVLYRRTENEMPGFKKSFESAKLSGVYFYWLSAPVKIIGKDGNVSGVKYIKMRLGEPDKTGRPRPVPIEGSEQVLKCDIVIKGLGQEPNKDFLSEISGLKIDKGSSVVINKNTGMTTIKGLFAGGDCVNGGREVVHAVKDGKIAAAGINSFCAKAVR